MDLTVLESSLFTFALASDHVPRPFWMALSSQIDREVLLKSLRGTLKEIQDDSAKVTSSLLMLLVHINKNIWSFDKDLCIAKIEFSRSLIMSHVFESDPFQ